MGNALLRKVASDGNKNARARVLDKFTVAQLKQNWIDSLSCPFPVDGDNIGSDSGGLDWVLGIDPDTSGALALLKPSDSGCTAQVCVMSF